MNKILSFLIVFVFGYSLICASPTVYGPSGLITIPTAESVKYKEIDFALDYFAVDGTTDAYQYLYKANLGTFRGCELGVVGGSVPTEGVYLNIKYYLMSNNERYPLSIAIGMENLASFYKTAIYMVASQRFQGGFIGHLGFKANFAEEELDPSLMGGIEYLLSNSISILGDFVGERKQYMVNTGVRVFVTEDLVIRLSALDITQSRDPITYTFGLSYAKFL
jgi:hypothetical protein